METNLYTSLSTPRRWLHANTALVIGAKRLQQACKPFKKSSTNLLFLFLVEHKFRIFLLGLFILLHFQETEIPLQQITVPIFILGLFFCFLLLLHHFFICLFHIPAGAYVIRKIRASISEGEHLDSPIITPCSAALGKKIFTPADKMNGNQIATEVKKIIIKKIKINKQITHKAKTRVLT